MTKGVIFNEPSFVAFFPRALLLGGNKEITLDHSGWKLVKKSHFSELSKLTKKFRDYFGTFWENVARLLKWDNMNILKHYGQKSSKTSLIKECNVLQMGHKNILHSKLQGSLPIKA